MPQHANGKKEILAIIKKSTELARDASGKLEILLKENALQGIECPECHGIDLDIHATCRDCGQEFHRHGDKTHWTRKETGEDITVYDTPVIQKGVPS